MPRSRKDLEADLLFILSQFPPRSSIEYIAEKLALFGFKRKTIKGGNANAKP